ncbi:MAG: NADH-quinone oxidoreductase subunit J [Chloroflexi bacterium]|nr:NADH-quinone oxidoreductase subunit J [Chloroflexota bacterium]MBM3174825.1 NADH-quinone oxidoreductase subunit J [Chloroflexota bacterium]MBM4450170.1 NADH-quinone oxidoreductase subunit J [Chloroflexota bacterium]
MFQVLLDHYPYYLSTALIVIGVWGMLAKHNLMKKVIGMNIFQTAIILLFISSSVKFGATVPTFDPKLGLENTALYVNPLPHVLMLTAIVVMVATNGVAFAILLLIYRRYRTLDEEEILRRMRE